MRAVCPACNGGTSNEQSMVISLFNTGEIKFNCHRASCGVAGNCLTNVSVVGKSSKALSPKDKAYSGVITKIPQDLWEDKFRKYDISEQELEEQGIVYALDINRIKFPVFDYRGYLIGENFKAVHSEKPKVLLRKFNNVPVLHFPLGQKFTEELVLVEDQTSAIKVAGVAYCAALMGTNLSDDGLSQLARMGLTSIVLMLDGDTPGREATIKLHRKLSPFFRVKVVFIENLKDPKDLSKEEIYQCIYSNK